MLCQGLLRKKLEKIKKILKNLLIFFGIYDKIMQYEKIAIANVKFYVRDPLSSV